MSAETEAACGQPCIVCGVNNGTTVLAHYSGQRQHHYGKGRGTKCRDFYAAPCCAACHETGPFAEGYIPPGYDQDSRWAQKAAASEEQLFYILEWHEKRLRNE